MVNESINKTTFYDYMNCQKQLNSREDNKTALISFVGINKFNNVSEKVSVFTNEKIIGYKGMEIECMDTIVHSNKNELLSLKARPIGYKHFTKEEKDFIKTYRDSHPHSKKLSDTQILAIMKFKPKQVRAPYGYQISETEYLDEWDMWNEFSEYSNPTPGVKYDDCNGLLECWSDGRFTYGEDYKNECRYFSADGTEITREYFDLAQRGLVEIVDGKAVDIVKVIKERLLDSRGRIDEIESHKGLIGKAKEKIASFFGSYTKEEKAYSALHKDEDTYYRSWISQPRQYSKEDVKYYFESNFGVPYNQENIEKFVKGEIKFESEKTCEEYQESQNSAVDTVGDIVSGILSLGVYSLAVAAAPFTAGTSIAIGIGAAALAGAGIKSGIKHLDALVGGRKYSGEERKRDLATGSFSGVIAPFTGGFGGAVGKATGKIIGVQAVKHFGKIGAEKCVKSGIKGAFKRMMLNPTGYEYFGKGFLRQYVAFGAEMMTDGAISSAADATFRTKYDGASWEEAKDAGKKGLLYGAIFSPVLGFGMKAVGKAGTILGNRVKGKSNYSKYCNDEYNFIIKERLNAANKKYGKLFNEIEMGDIAKKLEKQKDICLESPMLYVNGEYSSIKKARAEVKGFFKDYMEELFYLQGILDKNDFNNLLRKRFEDVVEYCSCIADFKTNELKLLKEITKCKNIDGQPLSSAQKISLIDIVQAYKENKITTEEMTKMAHAGSVDIEKLNTDLFSNILEKIGLTQSEIAAIPKEKLLSWDISNIHNLSKSILPDNEIRQIYQDMIRAASLDDFMKYIHDTSNEYGKCNAATKNIFEELGINYEKWIRPSKDAEVHFVMKDKNTEQLAQRAVQFENIIQQLRQPPLKSVVDKQLAQYLDGDKFVIPANVIKSKDKLSKFMSGVMKNLDNVKKRAEGNLKHENPEKALTANNTYTKFKDIERVIDDVTHIQINNDVTKSYDLTIKMWDRVPQKDVFQGNYSTCCIGQGECNGHAMPNYLMNTTFNMIEVVDNNTGKTIGNALCYMTKGKDDKLAFIVDNIEINNAQKGSDQVLRGIRQSIAEYASNVTKQITGTDETPVYMGGIYNDVPDLDLKHHRESVSIIGNLNPNVLYYADLFKGWNNPLDIQKRRVTLLKLETSP